MQKCLASSHNHKQAIKVNGKCSPEISIETKVVLKLTTVYDALVIITLLISSTKTFFKFDCYNCKGSA